MRNRLFSSLYMILLVSGILLFVLPQKDISIMEKRTLSNNSDIHLSDVFQGKFVTDVENVMKDQFYQREKVTSLYYRWKTVLEKVSGSLNNQAEGFENLTFTFLSEDVIEINDGYLINNVLLYDENDDHSAASRGYNVNEMALRYPSIQTYVYFPTRLEEIIDVGEGINYGLNYRYSFLGQLNSNIKWSALEINSLEDHQKFFFKSDHHWNIRGAYQGYADIINMIRKDFDIDEPREVLDEIVYPYEFHGNISSQVGMIGDTDHITDYVLNGIEVHELYANGVLTDLNDAKREYLENGNDTQYSDYDLFFGDNYFERIFDFHQDDKPNILIFGDSYTNVIQEWVASHFNKTVLIDLRARGEDFSLDKYIEEYQIDIILIVLPYNDLYFNGNMYIPLDD